MSQSNETVGNVSVAAATMTTVSSVAEELNMKFAGVKKVWENSTLSNETNVEKKTLMSDKKGVSQKQQIPSNNKMLSGSQVSSSSPPMMSMAFNVQQQQQQAYLYANLHSGTPTSPPTLPHQMFPHHPNPHHTAVAMAAAVTNNQVATLPYGQPSLASVPADASSMFNTNPANSSLHLQHQSPHSFNSAAAAAQLQQTAVPPITSLQQLNAALMNTPAPYGVPASANFLMAQIAQQQQQQQQQSHEHGQYSKFAGIHPSTIAANPLLKGGAFAPGPSPATHHWQLAGQQAASWAAGTPMAAAAAPQPGTAPNPLATHGFPLLANPVAVNLIHQRHAVAVAAAAAQQQSRATDANLSRPYFPIPDTHQYPISNDHSGQRNRGNSGNGGAGNNQLNQFQAQQHLQMLNVQKMSQNAALRQQQQQASLPYFPQGINPMAMAMVHMQQQQQHQQQSGADRGHNRTSPANQPISAQLPRPIQSSSSNKSGGGGGGGNSNRKQYKGMGGGGHRNNNYSNAGNGSNYANNAASNKNYMSSGGAPGGDLVGQQHLHHQHQSSALLPTATTPAQSLELGNHVNKD